MGATETSSEVHRYTIVEVYPFSLECLVVCPHISILRHFNLQNGEVYATICTLYTADSRNQFSKRDMIDSDVD